MLHLAVAFEQYHTMNLINSLKSNEGWLKVYKEAVVRRCSQACNFIKKETLAQVFSCEFCEISKNTSYSRTPLMAASVYNKLKIVF